MLFKDVLLVYGIVILVDIDCKKGFVYVDFIDYVGFVKVMVVSLVMIV